MHIRVNGNGLLRSKQARLDAGAVVLWKTSVEAEASVWHSCLFLSGAPSSPHPTSCLSHAPSLIHSL